MSEDTTTTLTAEESGKVVEDLIAVLPATAAQSSYFELLEELHAKGVCLGLTTKHDLVRAIAGAAPALADAGVACHHYRWNGAHRLTFTQTGHTEH